MKAGLKALSLSLLLLPLAPLAQAQSSVNFPLDKNLEGWALNLGKEFPGAEGKLEIDPAGGPEGGGAMKLAADFSNGGSYVAAGKLFEPGLAVMKLSFRVKSDLESVSLRVSDGEGQTHQRQLKLCKGEWQQVAVTEFGSQEKGAHHWGGVNDGVFRQPARAISFLALKPGGKGTFNTWICDVRIEAAKGKLDLSLNSILDSFVEPGKEGVIAFKASRAPEKEELRFKVQGYAGEIESEEEASYDPESGLIKAKIAPGQGFHEIAFKNGMSFGVCGLPKFKGEEDPFFAIDGAFSVFGSMRKDMAVPDAYLKTLKSHGVGHIRDRLSWGMLEKTQGGYDWESSGLMSLSIRERCLENKVQVLDVFHDAPAWTGATGRNADKDLACPYPRDLVATANSWLKIEKEWAKYWDGLEVWNEPDIGFGNYMPGDRPCALTKAISYTMAANRLDVPLVCCAFTGSTQPTDYFKLYVENGIFEDADVYSFHNYTSPRKLESVIAEYRELLKGNSRESIPFWITECGKPWKVGPPRPPIDQDAVSAMEIAMKAVEAKACGVAKHFPFVLPYYEENSNNFGMMDRRHSPLRSIDAYFVVAKNLSGKDYAGDLKLKDFSGVVQTRAFVGGGEAVAVVYSDDIAACKADLTGFESCSFEGVDGRKLKLDSDSRLSFEGGMAYLIGKPEAFKGKLKTDTKAMELFKTAKAWKPSPRRALPCVIEPDIDLAATPYDVKGYFIVDPSRPLEMAVKLNNLSESALKINPKFEISGDAAFEGPLPSGELELQAKSTTPLKLKARTGKDAGAKSLVKVKISDLNGNASPLVLSYLKRVSVIGKAYPAASVKDGEGWTDFSGKENWARLEGGETPSVKASFRTLWSKDKLNIQVRVEDSVFCQINSDASIWMGDSVQVALQALDAKRPFSRKYAEIAAAMTPSGPLLYRHADYAGDKKAVGPLKDSKLHFSSEKGVYVYDIELSTKELGFPELQPGGLLGFSILVNDNDGKGREGYLHWGDGIGATKSTFEYNLLELEN